MSRWAFLILMALAGCATASLGDKSAMLRVGMGKAEVQNILGPPRTTSVDGNRETWHYWKVGMLTPLPDDPMFAGTQNRLSVTFKEGKVEAWGDQQGWTGMMKSTMEATTAATAEMMKNLPPIKVDQTVYQAPAPKEGSEP